MDRTAATALFTPAAGEAARAFLPEPSEIALVAVSENVTFQVTDGRDGARYVLRLHRPGYNTLAELESERCWVRALREAGIAAPEGFAAQDGSEFVLVAIQGGGESRWAGLTRWTGGEILSEALGRGGDAAMVARRFRQLGALAAAIHDQADAWTPPAAFARRTLDGAGLMGEAPLWGRFWEHPGLSPEEARLMLATRHRIAAMLGRLGTEPPSFGLIHADLHVGNVLIDGDRLTLIDFDDAAFGWRLYEIAVALSHYQASPGFAAIEAAFLAGYRARRNLSDQAASLIPLFLLIRQLAVIGWLLQRPEIDASVRFGALKAAALAGCERLGAPC